MNVPYTVTYSFSEQSLKNHNITTVTPQ